MKKRILTGMLAFVLAFGGTSQMSFAASIDQEGTTETVTPETSETTETPETTTPETSEDGTVAGQPANPVYNEATDATKWDYVYFGRYPQSEVTGDDLSDAIVGANYNQDGDAVVENVKYRRTQESSEYHYYRWEPIQWRVLQNDGKSLLLLSDKQLIPMDCSSGGRSYVSSQARSFLNGYDEIENWEHIDYSGRNRSFLSQAFYAAEQDLLEIQEVGTTGAKDLIPIPTQSILTNVTYGFNSTTYSSYTRELQGTGYTKSSSWAYLYNNGDDIYRVDSNRLAWGVSYYYYYYLVPLIKINIDSNLWSMDRPDNTFQAKDITSVTVTLGKTSYVYDGTAKTPTVTVKDGNETLIEGMDYTVSYSNNTNAGTASVNIIGSGDYINTKTVDFTIEKTDQEISVADSFTKTTGSGTFKLNAMLQKGDGTFTYSSDNESVASVNQYGTVTVGKAGKATITVTAQETTNYKSASKTVQVTVENPPIDLIVTFNVNGGSALASDAKTKQVTSGETYGTLPTPTRTGYKFAGWYTGKTAGTRVTSATKVSVTKAQTLYAHWTARTYNVTLNVNGGNALSSSQRTKQVTYGTAYGTLANPARKGYTFAGWYTARDGGSRVTSTSKLQTAKAHTLYAHWTKVSVSRGKKPTLKSTKKKQLKITIKKVSGAKGYQIRYSTSAKFTKKTVKTVSPSELTQTITKLKSGKKYYVQVRAYKLDSANQKVYGAWSVSNSKVVK